MYVALASISSIIKNLEKQYVFVKFYFKSVKTFTEIFQMLQKPTRKTYEPYVISGHLSSSTDKKHFEKWHNDPYSLKEIIKTRMISIRNWLIMWMPMKTFWKSQNRWWNLRDVEKKNKKNTESGMSRNIISNDFEWKRFVQYDFVSRGHSWEMF